MSAVNQHHPPKFLPALQTLLPDCEFSHGPQDLEVHATDRWNYAASPELVALPTTSSEVSQILKFANSHQIPVTTRGAGVGYVGGCVPIRGGIALSVAKLNSILEINTEDGCVVTQPGVITGDLQSQVAAQGWYYPPDPASLAECSIGGNIATNAGGPRCLKYGVTKFYVLGVEVVLADGSIVRTGSRCHKNKTGFDLTSLIVGSEGLLGVVTEATLRIIPHPQDRAMLTATFDDFAQAARAVQAILDSKHLPSALEITDAFTLQAARDYLGLDSLPPGSAHLIVEIDGRKTALSAELDEIRSLLNLVGALDVESHHGAAECELVWKLRRDFSYSLRATGLTKLNEDVVVPRSRLVQLVDYARELEKSSGVSIACFGHAGDGNIHTNLMVESYQDPINKEKADRALDQLFAWIIANGGVITGEHGVGLAKKPWFREAIGQEAFATHQLIKKALDPQGILNPGKFLD